jgi:hypothetical protein
MGGNEIRTARVVSATWFSPDSDGPPKPGADWTKHSVKEAPDGVYIGFGVPLTHLYLVEDEDAVNYQPSTHCLIPPDSGWPDGRPEAEVYYFAPYGGGMGGGVCFGFIGTITKVNVPWDAYRSLVVDYPGNPTAWCLTAESNPYGGHRELGAMWLIASLTNQDYGWPITRPSLTDGAPIDELRQRREEAVRKEQAKWAQINAYRADIRSGNITPSLLCDQFKQQIREMAREMRENGCTKDQWTGEGSKALEGEAMFALERDYFSNAPGWEGLLAQDDRNLWDFFMAESDAYEARDDDSQSPFEAQVRAETIEEIYKVAEEVWS